MILLSSFWNLFIYTNCIDYMHKENPKALKIETNYDFSNHSEGILGMLETKLWDNPCPFAFRINYLALLYNTPLYKWVENQYGLKRPEYVVLYSLALTNGGNACDISKTSGFPKNTLSRAIKILESKGYLNKRSNKPGSGRRQALYLSEEGWKLIKETIGIFEKQENRMLKNLSIGERQILFELLSKVVLDSQDWAKLIPKNKEFNIGQDI